MIFVAREENFRCENCGEQVSPLGKGTYRNHCPVCLWSKHVDDVGPGDRASTCLGMMKPIGFDSRSGKGWMVIHECEQCGKIIPNKLAPDDEWEEIARHLGRLSD